MPHKSSHQASQRLAQRSRFQKAVVGGLRTHHFTLLTRADPQIKYGLPFPLNFHQIETGNPPIWIHTCINSTLKMDEQAMMAAIELLDSEDPDDEVIGIMVLMRIVAGGDEEEDEELLLLLAACDSNADRLPAPYLLIVSGTCRARMSMRGLC